MRDELPLLCELERAAGAPFAAIGMPEIADDEPPAPHELAHYLDAGVALVAVPDATDLPHVTDLPQQPGPGPIAGYLLAEPVDGALHIEQVSVHPDHARRGIGRALIEHLAAGTDAPALTLTTFADVPWNAPYYARCGFRPLADHEPHPGPAGDPPQGGRARSRPLAPALHAPGPRTGPPAGPPAGPHPGRARSAQLTPSRSTVVERNSSPGRSTVLGNAGWFGESGKCWVSSAIPANGPYGTPLAPVTAPWNLLAV